LKKESEISNGELNMKKSVSVSVLVIFCPACCNISSDVNKLFAVSDAGENSE